MGSLEDSECWFPGSQPEAPIEEVQGRAREDSFGFPQGFQLSHPGSTLTHSEWQGAKVVVTTSFLSSASSHKGAADPLS